MAAVIKPEYTKSSITPWELERRLSGGSPGTVDYKAPAPRSYKTNWTPQQMIGDAYTFEGGTPEVVEQLKLLNSLNSPMNSQQYSGFGSGGSVSPDILKLISDREKLINSRYGNLNQLLSQFGTQSRSSIDDATRAAMERLSGIDPQAAYTFNMVAPEVASANIDYLKAIGADPAAVFAQQALSQSLINQSVDSAKQYASGTQSVLDAERAARQAAAALYGQEATGNLESNILAQQLAMELAKSREMQALEEMRFQYGV